ncbi:hypothetical protein GDO86_008019 [Hymenochirus boettgeri]|uniref:Uncharacterized protein n=1 Tax=Hymenochirus boettgeri TaxID=247094 RepID=A0A8T2J3A1_9PIPI|nr:hypothetical protein GDO86_008019 [Hymenochirus boettgeri]
MYIDSTNVQNSKWQTYPAVIRCPQNSNKYKADMKETPGNPGLMSLNLAGSSPGHMAVQQFNRRRPLSDKEGNRNKHIQRNRFSWRSGTYVGPCPGLFTRTHRKSFVRFSPPR